jgi:alpha-glucuronidase
MKELAFADYLEDKLTLQQIADKYNVTYPKVIGWMARNNWHDEKVKKQKEIKRSIFFKYQNQIEQTSSRMIEFARISSQMGLERLVHHYEQGNHLKDTKSSDPNDKKTYRHFLADLSEWTKILKSSSVILKDVAPDAGEEIVELMIKELKALNVDFGGK